MSHKIVSWADPGFGPMTLRTLDGDRDALQRLVEKMFDREEEGYKYCLSQFSLELKDLSNCHSGLDAEFMFWGRVRKSIAWLLCSRKSYMA